MWKAFNSVGLDFHNEYVLRIVPSADNPSDLLCLTSDDINSCARVYGTQEYWKGKWPVPPPLKPLLNLWYHEAEELRKVVPARPLTDNEIHAIADNCARDWPLNVRWRAYEAANRISGSTANCPEMRSGKVPKY